MKRLFFFSSPIGWLSLLCCLLLIADVSCKNERGALEPELSQRSLLDRLAYYNARADQNMLIDTYRTFGKLSKIQEDYNNWIWARCMTAKAYRDINRVDSLAYIMDQTHTILDTASFQIADSTQARVYLVQAMAVLFTQKDLQATFPLFQKAAATAPDHPVAIQAECLISSLYMSMGKLAEGNAKLDSAILHANKVLSEASPAMITVNIQNAARWTMMEDHAKALEVYLHIIEQERQRNSPYLYALGVAYLGGEQAALNLGQEALFLSLNDSLRALPLDEIANGELMRGTAYTHRAAYAEQIGDVEEAKQWATTGLQLVNAYSEGSAYTDDAGNTLAQILVRTGQLDSAARYLLPLVQKQSQFMGESSPFLILGYVQLVHIFTGLKEYDSAYVYVQKLKQLSSHSQHHAQVVILNAEVNLYMKWGKFAQAKQAAKAYNELLPLIRQPIALGGAYVHLGMLAREEGKTAKAFDLFHKGWLAITDLKEMKSVDAFDLAKINDIPFAVRILTHIANLHDEEYQKNHQEQDLKASIDLLDRALHISALSSVMYKEQQSHRLLQETIRPTYEKALTQCYEAYRLKQDKLWIKQAIKLSERNKSQQLRQSIREDEGLKLAQVAPAIYRSLKRLEFLIAGKKNQIEMAYGHPQLFAYVPKFEQERFMLEDSLLSLIQHLERDYPDFFQAKFQVEPMSVSEMQASLPEQTALLLYSLGKDALHTFVLGADTMIWHRSPTAIDSIHLWTENIYQMCKTEFSSTENEQAQINPYLATASNLYHTLIQPLHPYLKQVEHLHIAPDNFLYKLPFEALVVDGSMTASNTFEDLDYLIHTWDVSYTYAVSTSLGTGGPSKLARDSWIGYGPFTPELQAKIKKKKNQTESDKSFVKMFSLQLQNELIESLGRRSGFQAKIGKAATKADFFSHAPEAGAIHLGLHSEANLDQPHNSELIFAPDIAAGGNRLLAHEISTMSLKANFIFLAGCQTNSGTIQFGEGLLSLARRFQMAGCRSLIANRWDAKSRETTEIAELFYDSLFQGESKHLALNNAKRSYITNPTTISSYKHPRYWASLSLIGETGLWEPGLPN
ncbi:MAG: CHAT domain-containing protein [Bacteroidota bacterium]